MIDEAPARQLTPKGQATRDRIVDAAVELVARHGVAGVSNEQVRRLAGVSGSQLSHYFDSKQALIRAVITRQADATGGLPQLGALDSFDALEAWTQAAIARQRENDGRGECDLGALAGQLTPDDEASRAAASDGFLRWRDVIRSGLAAMQAHGDLCLEADVDELAYALLAALQGGSLLAQTLRDVAPMEAALNAALGHVRSFAA